MIIEEQIIINASKETIFDIYRDVEQWNAWDPDTKESFLSGPFEVGSKGRLVPAKGSSVPIEMTKMVPNKEFTVESRLPLFRMVFDHELMEKKNGTQVVHRVTFSGPLKFFFVRFVEPQVREGLPKTMISLKKFVESKV